MPEDPVTDFEGDDRESNDHDRSVAAAVAHTSATMADRQTDVETLSMADWQPYAVDPRTHRESD